MASLAMPCSFKAYIDESGDEGFKFKPNGRGSSSWFVLSAVVVRAGRDHELVKLMAKCREVLGSQPKRQLHFRNLNHSQRKAYVKQMADCQNAMKAIFIAINKELLPSDSMAKYASTPHMLYRYATRLLLERIAGLCDDVGPAQGDIGDGSVALIFSNRGQMSYDLIREYIATLNQRTAQNPGKYKVPSSVIRPENVSAVAHEQLAGLQFADAAASSMYMCLNVDAYGETEQAYISALAPIIRKSKVGAIDGYGVKWWPDIEKIKKANPHLSDWPFTK